MDDIELKKFHILNCFIFIVGNFGFYQVHFKILTIFEFFSFSKTFLVNKNTFIQVITIIIKLTRTVLCKLFCRAFESTKNFYFLFSICQKINKFISLKKKRIWEVRRGINITNILRAAFSTKVLYPAFLHFIFVFFVENKFL